MYDARQPVSQLIGTLAAEDLSATGLVGYSHLLAESCNVQMLYARVTTSVVSTPTSAILTFYARPTIGSATSQLTLGTVAIPGGTAAGKTVYKAINPVLVPAGYQLVADVTTAATASGAAVAIFGAAYSPEEPANEPNFIASV